MKRVFLCLMLAATSAFAADRHVFLDTDADGTLNTCPNPVHNSTLTAGNTSDMTYCASGADTGKIIGTHTGYVTSCAGGVNPSNVTNGVSADVDGDGTTEVVYGHPQACVWNMATSDSCEVHSGTYIASGAYSDSNSQNASNGEIAGCDRMNCWFASVLAPGPSSGAYGTSGSPGYLRGASMNSSIDSWDPNGDKNPADGTYPAIFSGDRDNDAAFDTTTGSDSDNTGTFTGLAPSFRGDAFLAVVIGCMATTSNAYSWCGTGHSDNPWIDTDADGDFDTRGNIGNRDPAFLIIKDLEFKRYNGGNAVGPQGSVHPFNGSIILTGDQSTDGLVVDHIYFHDSDYSQSAVAGAESYWAMLDDSQNASCPSYTEIKNSHLEQNNEKLIDDDCGLGIECGCPKNFHNNLVVFNVTSSQASTGDGRDPVFAYIKSVDTAGGGSRKKQHRFWNNEFVMSATTQTGSRRFMDLQAFGNSMGGNQGELWVYGNIFRALGTPKWERFWNGSCGIGTGSGRVYFFNNTVDMTFNSNGSGMLTPCTDTNGEINVGKNNAYWTGGTRIFIHDWQDGAPPTGSGDSATEAFENEYCTQADTSSPSGQNCTVPSTVTHGAWFAGTSASTSLYDGFTNLAAKVSGPLDNITANTACDPDDDGAAGVDYNFDGINDLSWSDIAGNTVSCPTSSTAIDIGAVQSGGGGSATCGNGVIEGSEQCDVVLGGATCITRGYAQGGTLTCSGGCTFNTSNCCGDNVKGTSETCDGTDLNSQSCITQEFAGGTLACATACNAFNTASCTVATTVTGELKGISLNGVAKQ